MLTRLKCASYRLPQPELQGLRSDSPYTRIVIAINRVHVEPALY